MQINHAVSQLKESASHFPNANYITNVQTGSAHIGFTWLIVVLNLFVVLTVFEEWTCERFTPPSRIIDNAFKPKRFAWFVIYTEGERDERAFALIVRDADLNFRTKRYQRRRRLRGPGEGQRRLLATNPQDASTTETSWGRDFVVRLRDAMPAFPERAFIPQ